MRFAVLDALLRTLIVYLRFEFSRSTFRFRQKAEAPNGISAFLIARLVVWARERARGIFSTFSRLLASSEAIKLACSRAGGRTLPHNNCYSKRRFVSRSGPRASD